MVNLSKVVRLFGVMYVRLYLSKALKNTRLI
nr:MAG TPA: hypothetical protein [Caudoviricetes sp.]DAK59685.1 MAG TPA: hypothetical protein [Caudoviricetes sp.]DAP72482.1 MAG TPA: hypothetical protein [Caudoviricetes sp.]